MDKYLGLSHRIRPQGRARGNALFMVLIAIVVLAALTYAISQSSTEQSSVLPRQTSANEINQLITYTSALGGALQQMVTNGENPNTLYCSNSCSCSSSSCSGGSSCCGVSLLQPGQAGFETAPSNLKIYHPLGGGITYMSQSSPATTAVAKGYNINPNAIITGVGCSSGTGCPGHIVFGATISSVSYCEQINNILTGTSLTTVPPVMNGDFTTLFTTTTAVTVGTDCTPSCANIPRQCVSNAGATSWGFYADLFPPQYSNTQ
jgi:Tfp pilus assembly protein PilX